MDNSKRKMKIQLLLFHCFYFIFFINTVVCQFSFGTYFTISLHNLVFPKFIFVTFPTKRRIRRKQKFKETKV